VTEWPGVVASRGNRVGPYHGILNAAMGMASRTVGSGRCGYVHPVNSK